MRELDVRWFRACLQWLLLSVTTRLQNAPSLFKTALRSLNKVYYRFRAMLPRWGGKQSDEQQNYKKLMEYNQLMKVRHCSTRYRS